MKKIPKLKLHLWQELIYMLFVLVAPATITAIELFQSHSMILKISLASIGSLLITLIVVKKFFINHKIEKWREKIVALEHDYSIEVGNAENCKQQWALYNLFIFIYNAICIIVALVLMILFVNALVDGLIAFKGAVLLILLFAFIGITFKIICYLTYAKEVKKEDEEDEKNVDI